MKQKKRSVKARIAASNAPDPVSALLVPPTVPKLVPDVEGGLPNTVEFRATYLPLRVEFPLWAHSNPSEKDNEYLTLYWNNVEVQTKTFTRPIQPDELFILVPVSKLIEGQHQLHYKVTIFNDTRVASRPLVINIDKTPPMLDHQDDRLRFTEDVIDKGVTEDYLKKNNDEVIGEVPPILGAEPGDVVKWFWSDDIVGLHMVNMMTLTAEHIDTGNQSKLIELRFPGDFIRQSKEGTRFVRYEVQDRAGTAVQRSLPRSLQSKPSAPPRVLPPPRIKEATGSDYFSTLLPSNAVNGVTFVIPDDAEIRPNETVTVTWGVPGTLGGYSTSTPSSPGSREFLIPRVHVAPHMNSRVELYYNINIPDMPPFSLTLCHRTGSRRLTVRTVQQDPEWCDQPAHNGQQRKLHPGRMVVQASLAVRQCVDSRR